MNWLNVKILSLRSHLLSGATHEELGIWLRLITFCCEQENNGFIHGADKWSDRQWITCAGVTKLELDRISQLWHFNSVGSLVVSEYPTQKQAEIQAKRKAGFATAKQRKKQSKNSSATRSAISSPRAEGEREVEGEPDSTSNGDGKVLELPPAYRSTAV